MRVLVTGASGFVGGALLERLEHDGVDVLGIGRRRLARERYASVDLERPLTTASLPDGFRPHVIVHAAARATPWGSRERFEAQNVLATRNVVEFAAGLPRPARVVHVSTSSIFYRPWDQDDLDEHAPVGPFLGLYAATKRRSELVVAAHRGPWTILRPRAVIGRGDTTLLPRILEAARAGRLPRIGSSTAPSSVTTIDTLVEALVRALHAPGVVGRAVNVSNDEPVVIQELLADVLRALHVAPPSRTVPLRAALASAGALEAAWRLTGRRDQPPITRYGVAVLGTAKRFDNARMHRLLGAPAESVERGVERMLAEGW